MAYFFACGSNWSMAQMRKRRPNSILIGPARLQNYKLDFTIFDPNRWDGEGAAL
jgi:hypothetical protein